MHGGKNRFFMAANSLLYAALLVLFVLAAGLCSSNRVAFRPLVSDDDLEGKRTDTFPHNDGVVYIWKLRYLSDRDIDRVDIFRSATAANRLLVSFTINPDGAKRLRHFTNKFGMRRLAVFADGRLLDMIPPVPPAFLGDRIVVRWPGTERELRLFATNVNKRPPGIMALYIDEIGRYNGVAAEAWARAYEGFNRFVENGWANSKLDRAIVDETRNQGN
jgi:hypothetical protein